MVDDMCDLTWNDFSSNAANMVKNLLNDSQFTDVTLVSDDRKLIKAHKVILSSCSQFFSQILTEISSQHPVLFLKGIQYSELSPIIRFIYIGTTEIAEQDLGRFMRAAQDLQIEGLQKKINAKADIHNFVNQQNMNDENFQKQEIVAYEDSKYEEDEQFIDSAVYQENKQVDLQNVYHTKSRDGVYSCDMCEYKTKRTYNLKTHRQGKHLGVRLSCNRCTSEFYDKSTLTKHVLSKHGKM